MRAFRFGPAGANLLCHDLEGDGSPLLFLHGLGCASSCDYPRIAADAALAGRRMVLLDLLGSGFSERPPAFDYSVEGHARSVAELVRHAAFDRLSIYGHSMGGAVAIVLASLLGAKVERLVLSEPNLDAGGGSFSRRIAAFSEAVYVARGHAETVADARREGNVVWAASLAVSAPFAVHRAARSLVAGGQPAWRETLYGLSVSKTLLFGERSLPDPDFERLPLHGVAVGVVPAAGHSMACDNPAGLAAALAGALR